MVTRIKHNELKVGSTYVTYNTYWDKTDEIVITERNGNTIWAKYTDHPERSAFVTHDTNEFYEIRK